jgi:1-acyl-sn-glycerol-3-phosphate acyltransferase
MPQGQVIPLAGRAGERAQAQRAATVEPEWYRELSDLLAFAGRRMRGDYAVDEFGFDPDLADHVLLPLLRPLYRTWFRVQTTGIDHLPATGGALVVANHSGTLPFDALMTAMAVHEEHPGRRHLRMLGTDLVFRMPISARWRASRARPWRVGPTPSGC